MGTNYYLFEKHPCTACGRPYDKLHIGKSSGGWCFSLHVIPEENINSIIDWVIRWNNPEAYIEDEYDTKITKQEMIDIITKREGNSDFSKPYSSGSYKSWEDFHRSNGSEPGPNGLVRHKVDRDHCIKNGEGTYDYIKGEFS